MPINRLESYPLPLRTSSTHWWTYLSLYPQHPSHAILFILPHFYIHIRALWQTAPSNPPKFWLKSRNMLELALYSCTICCSLVGRGLNYSIKRLRKSNERSNEKSRPLRNNSPRSWMSKEGSLSDSHTLSSSGLYLVLWYIFF